MSTRFYPGQNDYIAQLNSLDDLVSTMTINYYGPFAAAPTTRPDGSARQPGDRYFDTVAGAEKTWNGTSWFIPNVDAAAVALQMLQVTGETADQLGGVSAKLLAGTAVVVDCHGDSTMWGADPGAGFAQVATPSPAAMCNFVNLFYGNTALTVNNRAISGTTATQMIAGTDGSGTTFAAKMATSAASVVYCNHGVNDALGTNQTTAAQFKSALVAFVKTCRAYSKTPVLVTPYISLTFGTFGSPLRAESHKYFAQIVRDVAREFSVFLVDNYRALEGMLAGGKYRPLDLLPDAVHATQAVYYSMGYNLAAPLVGVMRPITAPDQFVVATEGNVLATQQSSQVATPSRFGVLVGTSDSGAQSLRMLFKVDEPGMDLCLAHPMWGNGNPAVPISLDGSAVGTISMYSSGFSGAVSYIHDNELLIAKNIDVGMHIVHMSVASGGGLGVYYLRSRKSATPSRFVKNSALPVVRRLLSSGRAMESTVTDTTALWDDLPSSRLLNDFELEFTAKMLPSSGVCLNGFVYGAGAGAGTASQGVMLWFTGEGYPTVAESTSPGDFANTQISSTNYTTATHLWRILVTKQGTGAGGFGTVKVYADDVQIGTTVNLTKPYYGGFIGIWKADSAGIVDVRNLAQVVR